MVMTDFCSKRPLLVISMAMTTLCLYIYQYNMESIRTSHTLLNALMPFHRHSHNYEHPLCENLLDNITKGNWVSKSSLVSNYSEEYQQLLSKDLEYDTHLEYVRAAKGIHNRIWRDDGKCGFKNKQDLPNGSAWPLTGSWCLAKSNKPCCSDEDDGVCGTICDCPRCIDMRDLIHAELGSWTLRDKRCHWREYSSVTACDVIRNYEHIHFFGDSLTRKLARAFILFMRNNYHDGALLKTDDEEQRRVCTDADQFYYRQCKIKSGYFASVLDDQRHICGMELTRFQMTLYFGLSDEPTLLQAVKDLAGRSGAVIILGMGLHMNCNFGKVVTIHLKPALSYLKQYYSNHSLSAMRWPHIVFLPPDTNSVLKPLRARVRNGNKFCERYTTRMIHFCQDNQIPVLNFRDLTKSVHSYDGTHYGLGVNVMKVQLLLNYLDQFRTKYAMGL